MAEDSKSSNQILETSFSIDWLTENLYKSCLAGTDCPKDPLTDWHAEKVGIGMGFLSHIIKVKLNWKANPENKLPSSVIMKVPTMETFKKLGEEAIEKKRAEGEEVPDDTEVPIPEKFANEVHVTECTFYDIMRGVSPAPCKIPRSFFSETGADGGQGVLVFEDLSDRGMCSLLHVGLNLKQCFQLAENLAGIHAWSLQNKGWEEKLPLPNRNNFDKMSDMMTPLLDNAKKAQAHVFTPEMIDPLYDLVKDMDASWYYAYTVHKEFDMPPVLCQGDLWMNNILWNKETDKDGNPKAGDELVAMIDWQISHPGCAAEDFARFFGTSCSTSVRRNYAEETLKHYYDKLKENLGKETPFSFHTLMKSYDRMMVYCMFGGMAPLMMAEMAFKGLTRKQYDDMLFRARDLIEDAKSHIPGYNKE